MDEQRRAGSGGPGDPGRSGDPYGYDDDTGSPRHEAGGTAGILETIREAVDELAERATPTVREFSARAAELTAVVAVKAAPLVKRAGEATAVASEKLAERSRDFAADIRANAPDRSARGPAGTGSGPGPTGDDPSDLAADQPTQPEAAPPFETTAEEGAPGPGYEPSDGDERRVDPPGF